MAQILLVEDTADILIVLMEVLESEGYTVHSCSDGKAALDYLNHCIRCPDIVITDIVMPRMGGIELAQAMKQDDKLKGIPIALYSAMAKYKQLAKEMDCYFLSKPFDISDILTLVERATRTRGNYEKTS